MKAFVVYVKDHKGSESQAKGAIQSLRNSKFDVEKLEGATPKTLNEYRTIADHIPGSRVSNFFREDPRGKYMNKKSCFTNHLCVWEKCVDLGQPVAFLEHDAWCVRDWDNPQFDELLILNITSAWKVNTFSHLNTSAFTWDLGVNDYTISPLPYNKPVEEFTGGYMIPGTAAYAIQPKAAEKLLKLANRIGWEQSDFFINTKSVKMQYVVPEYFTFNSAQHLNMSHVF